VILISILPTQKTYTPYLYKELWNLAWVGFLWLLRMHWFSLS